MPLETHPTARSGLKQRKLDFAEQFEKALRENADERYSLFEALGRLVVEKIGAARSAHSEESISTG